MAIFLHEEFEKVSKGIFFLDICCIWRKTRYLSVPIVFVETSSESKYHGKVLKK